MELSEIFDEWNTYSMQKKLLPRDIDLDAIIENSRHKIIAISGIRRSGKSSILTLIAQRIVEKGGKCGYVNVEDSRFGEHINLLDEILEWFGDEGFLILDEVTSASDWEGWLARNHELLKGKLCLIVSSSRSSLATPGKSLRGRTLTYEVFPLSFSEFLRFKNIKIERTTAGKGRVKRAFSEYLKYGGFPEVVLTDNGIDKVKILASYFRDIIGLDIADISGQDFSTIELFGRYVLQSSYFSASKCLNFLKTLGYKIGKEKILELEKYAETSYLFFFLPIFSHKVKNRSQYPRKAYPGDAGFCYGMTGKLDYGRIYEVCVFLELRRNLRGRSLHYWRNVSGSEVDFLVMEGNELAMAIQVCYDAEARDTNERELRDIIDCTEECGTARSLIITGSLRKTVVKKGISIEFIPFTDWVLNDK